MDVIFRKENESVFCDGWNRYLASHPSAVRYCLEMLDYYRRCSPYGMEDFSFILLQNKEPVAVAFVPVETCGDVRSITFAGGYCPAPLSSTDAAERAVYAELLKIARQQDVGAIKLLLDPLIVAQTAAYNTPVKYGFIDTSSSNGLVDLRKPSLRDGLREGHWRNIQRTLKNGDYSLHLMDHASADYAVHEQYRALHRLCAGRETRSKATFDLQFDLLKTDKAFLAGLRHGARYIGFAYFLHFNGTALYLSAADDPEYADQQKLPVYHSLIWSAMEYYRTRKFSWLDLSPPFSPSVQWDEYVDDKQKRIAHFKRGFGTQEVPLFRGALYLREDVFLNDLETFKKNLLSEISRNQKAPAAEEPDGVH